MSTVLAAQPMPASVRVSSSWVPFSIVARQRLACLSAACPVVVSIVRYACSPHTPRDCVFGAHRPRLSCESIVSLSPVVPRGGRHDPAFAKATARKAKRSSRQEKQSSRETVLRLIQTTVQILQVQHCAVVLYRVILVACRTRRRERVKYCTHTRENSVKNCKLLCKFSSRDAEYFGAICRFRRAAPDAGQGG